jgi:hypothetical protein
VSATVSFAGNSRVIDAKGAGHSEFNEKRIGGSMTTEQRALLERFIRLVSTESKYTSEDDDQWLAENWWIVREMRLIDPQAELQRNHWVTAYEVRFKPAKRNPAKVLTASEILLILGAVEIGEP